MFSNKELRSWAGGWLEGGWAGRYMYCYLTDWSGGIYATPTMRLAVDREALRDELRTGSRPGGPVAATWAAMRRHN